MIIGRSMVAMAAQHRREIEQTRTESLRVWDNRAGDARRLASGPANLSANRAPAAPASTTSPPAVGANAEEPSGCPASEVDGKFTVLIALIERLTGRKIVLLDPRDVTRECTGAARSVNTATGAAATGQSQPASQGWGVDYRLTEVRRESEHTAFSAVGKVTTADGREIAFAAHLTLDRASLQVTDVRVRAGDALTDPLVLNFGTAPVALTPTKIDFDLNADGAAERISFVADGNGFLVLDANANGRVDDGRELFGPLSGDGFAELARHDADGNGWIDEADPVYGQLRIWDQANGGLSTMAERGVGAIGLARVATPFQLDAAGETAGALRGSGVWLGETGTVGTVHQIDLVT